jgi:hypothetical protein
MRLGELPRMPTWIERHSFDRVYFNVFHSSEMITVDPQSDAYQEFLSRQSAINFPNRNNWEFQERVRQHLIADHAGDYMNTSSFSNKPPSQFPLWINTDANEKSLGYNFSQNMDENVKREQDSQDPLKDQPTQKEESDSEDVLPGLLNINPPKNPTVTQP